MKHGFDFMKREDEKYQKAIKRFCVSASEVGDWIRKRYHAIEFFEASPTWIIEKTMIYLNEKSGAKGEKK